VSLHLLFQLLLNEEDDADDFTGVLFGVGDWLTGAFRLQKEYNGALVSVNQERTFLFLYESRKENARSTRLATINGFATYAYVNK